MSEHDTTTEVAGGGKAMSDLRRVLQDSTLKVTSYYSEFYDFSTDAKTLLADFKTLKDAAEGIATALAGAADDAKAGLAAEFAAIVKRIEAVSKDKVAATTAARGERQTAVDAIVKDATALKARVATSIQDKVRQEREQVIREQARVLRELQSEFEKTVGVVLKEHALLLDNNVRGNAGEAARWFADKPTEKQIANIRQQIQDCRTGDWARVFPAHVELTESMAGAALQAPAVATPEQIETIGALRDAMTKALATRPISAATVTAAGKQADLIRAEIGRIISGNEDARLKERERLLALLGDPAHGTPPEATAEQAEALEVLRAAVRQTLAVDPPTPQTIKQATTAAAAIAAAVATLAKGIAAAALATRSQAVQADVGKMKLAAIDRLVGTAEGFEDEKTTLAKAMAALQLDPANAAAVQQAELMLHKLKQRVADLKLDFTNQVASYNAALTSYTYLDAKTDALTDQGDAKDIRTRLFDLRTRLKAAIDGARFGAFDADAEAAIGADLIAMRSLATRVAAAGRAASAAEPTFDWQDSSTWVRKPLRFAGKGTKAYVEALDADYLSGLIKTIEDCGAGDRHSHAVLTGVAMHDHTVAGSQGIAFCYNHIGGRAVEPVIYDFATSRDGNKYYWSYGGKSGGPPRVPEDVKANRSS